MKKKTILIVEDDKVLLELYEIKIKNAGFLVQKASNGEEALRLIKKKKPDLILLDILMPKMDGFSFLKNLKGNLKILDIPIIILSNLAQEFEIQEGYRLSAVKYLVKANYTPEEVVEEIKKSLKNTYGYKKE